VNETAKPEQRAHTRTVGLFPTQHFGVVAKPTTPDLGTCGSFAPSGGKGATEMRQGY